MDNRTRLLKLLSHRQATLLVLTICLNFGGSIARAAELEETTHQTHPTQTEQTVAGMSLAQAPAASEVAAPASAPAATATAPAKKHYGLSALPMRVASIVAGTIVGTPVCMVRCSIWEEKYGVRGMVGDTDDKFLQAAAGTFWFPLGLMAGVPEAPFSALKRSYANSDKPFSKDQFSLGHIDWK